MQCVYDEHAQGNAPFLSFPYLTLPSHFAQSRDFAEVWVEWEKYRREKKQTLKQTTVERQIKELTKHPLPVAIATLEVSIKNGWTGLFPEKVSPPTEPVLTLRQQLAAQMAAQ